MNTVAPIPANDDGVIAQPQAPGTLIAFLARAVHDPSVDVHKLEAIYRMHRETVADERRAEFHEAMSAVQREMLAVVRNAFNDQTRSKFATLEAIDAAIRPVYTKYGFRLSFTETPSDAAELKISCVCSRRGHEETYYLSALSDTVGPQGKPNKTNVQGVGSSVSYLRRYLTCMIFNVALRDDNDGNRVKPNTETGELISGPQLAELRALLAACSSDPAAIATNETHFLGKMGLGDMRSLADVPPLKFPILRTALIDKRNKVNAARQAHNKELAA